MEQPKALRGHHFPPPAGRGSGAGRGLPHAGRSWRGWTGCTSSPAAPPTMWGLRPNTPWSGCCASRWRWHWPQSSATVTPSSPERTLAVVISQSGETIDTLAAMREARRLGARLLSIVNVVGVHHCPGVGRRDLHLGRAGDRRSHHKGILHPAGGHLSAGPAFRPSAGHSGGGGVRRHGSPAEAAPRQGGGDPVRHRKASSTTPLSTSTTTPCSSSGGTSTTPWGWRAP